MKTRLSRTLHLSLALGILAAGVWSAGASRANAGAFSPTWQSKVDARVLADAHNGDTEFIILLAEQADLSGAAALETKAEKGKYVYQRLTEVAQRSQGPVLNELKRRGAEYQSYWVSNMIWARGSSELVQTLARRKDVARLAGNPHVRLQEPEQGKDTKTILSPDALQPSSLPWNLVKVHADDVWAMGVTGQGAVIGGQDTGYAWQHPALINQYRGWNGSTANHDYAWHDAIHAEDSNNTTINPCGMNTTAPCDDSGHGTHTMGTMVGEANGSFPRIGLAPGAKWIGCRNMESGWGTPATYAECYQWFIAPTRIDGSDPRPDLAPDVINNSWTCPPREGCVDWDVLQGAVEAVRAAGIVTAHAAGNYRNLNEVCSTIRTPAAIYDASFTVGATTQTDASASFSSWGPVTIDGSNRLKPDISAPGMEIYSSFTTPAYNTLNGTSMAAPHVAGLVALLVSANSSLRGQPDLLEWVIEQSAVPLTSGVTCGGVPGSSIPNNSFGWGRIDAYAAYQLVTPKLSKSVSQLLGDFGDLLTYTLTITNSAVLSPATNVILTDAIPAHTSLIGATQPYSQTGDVLRWDFGSLSTGESRSVTMTVQTPISSTVLIENSAYGTISDELAVPVSGAPVISLNGYHYRFPIISR